MDILGLYLIIPHETSLRVLKEALVNRVGKTIFTEKPPTCGCIFMAKLDSEFIKTLMFNPLL